MIAPRSADPKCRGRAEVAGERGGAVGRASTQALPRAGGQRGVSPPRRVGALLGLHGSLQGGTARLTPRDSVVLFIIIIFVKYKPC